uniref:hypothetical protein n=1 Tax=Milkweed yellows phytoplasma TaxID=208434 RepID=UPI0005661BDD
IKLNFENTFEKQNSFISIPNVSNQQINKIQEEFKQNFKYKDKINSHIYLNQDKKEIIIYWPKIRNFVNKEYLFATTFCKEETNNHIVETNCSLYFKIIKNDDEQFKIEILNPKIDLKIIQ